MNFTPQFGGGMPPGFSHLVPQQQTAQNATRVANPTTMGPSYANSDTFSTHSPVNMSGPGLGSMPQNNPAQQPGYNPQMGAPTAQSVHGTNPGYSVPALTNPNNGLHGIYQNELGRGADQAGQEFYQDLMDNQGYSLVQVENLIRGSDEAQKYRATGQVGNVFDQANANMLNAQRMFGQRMYAPQVTAQQVTADRFPDANINEYMNPFTGAVTNTTMDELERQRQIAMNGTNASASGAFGGSRHGVMQAETNRGFGDVAARTVAGLTSDAYNNAQGAVFQDIGNKLAADQGNQSANLQASLANASNSLTANSQNLQGASGLAQLSNMGFSRGQSALDAQMQAGNMQQALQQQIINAGKQQTNNDTGFTDEALARLVAAMGSAKYGTSTTDSKTPSWGGLLTAFL